jgi:acyl-coenzyme A thioesterase PaaI-like protein
LAGIGPPTEFSPMEFSPMEFSRGSLIRVAAIGRRYFAVTLPPDNRSHVPLGT